VLQGNEMIDNHLISFSSELPRASSSAVFKPDSSLDVIEKQAEDPLPSGGVMNAVPNAFET